MPSQISFTEMDVIRLHNKIRHVGDDPVDTLCDLLSREREHPRDKPLQGSWKNGADPKATSTHCAPSQT